MADLDFQDPGKIKTSYLDCELLTRVHKIHGNFSPVTSVHELINVAPQNRWFSKFLSLA